MANPSDPQLIWNSDAALRALGVRVWGDPFTPGPLVERLRRTIFALEAAGIPVSLVLPPGMSERPQRGSAEPGRTAVELSSGAREFTVWTDAGAADRQRMGAALGREVGAHAPVVVATPGVRELAQVAWPGAPVILAGADGVSPVRLAATLRPGTLQPGCQELAAWLALPECPSGSGELVHLATSTGAAGTHALLREWAVLPDRPPLRLLVCDGRLAEELGAGPHADHPALSLGSLPGPMSLTPGHLLEAAAVVQPDGVLPDPVWRILLASGRPLAAGVHPGNAGILVGTDATAHGALVQIPMDRSARGGWAPRRGWLPHTLAAIGADGAAIAMRARRRVVREWAAPQLSAGRGFSPGDEALPALPRTRTRPVVVLESPLLEPSSAAELTIDTARALVAQQACGRDDIDLHIVPVAPFHRDMDWLQRRAPELVPHVRPAPQRADVWITRSWPLRVSRPPARLAIWRVDQEYGAVRTEQLQALRSAADLVAVHSSAVAGMLRSAGIPGDRLRVWPHGVDGSTFSADGPGHAEVRRFQADHPGAVSLLFVGGLIWRKGVDRWLDTVMWLHREFLAGRGPGVCGVLKTPGGGEHYAGYGLEALVHKVAGAAGGPPLLILEQEMDRSELASVYRSCDALLHPYRGEGFGMPVLEARACGLPVVVTGGGSTDDFCSGRPGEDGSLRVPAGFRALDLPEPHLPRPWVLEPDQDGLRAAVQQVLRDPMAVREQAMAASGSVAVRNSWSAVARAILDLAHHVAVAPEPPMGAGAGAQAVVVPTSVGRIAPSKNPIGAQALSPASS